VRKIGVLALQGDFREHIFMLRQSGAEALPIRWPEQLQGLDGLIIPGGESTTISKLMTEYKLGEEIQKLAAEGLPLFGTCAGMVLLAKRVIGLDFQPLAVIDIEVRRNAFGRQVDSFETELLIPILGQKPFPAVFIRAPRIERAGDGVQSIAQLQDGTAVAAMGENILVSAFHPELTEDTRLHEYFLNIVEARCKSKEG
jgi:5'-phosphate synthase pdxT subunit